MKEETINIDCPECGSPEAVQGHYGFGYYIECFECDYFESDSEG